MTFYRHPNSIKSVNNTTHQTYMDEFNAKDDDGDMLSSYTSSSSLSNDHVYTSPSTRHTSHRLSNNHKLQKKRNNKSQLSYHMHPKKSSTNAQQRLSRASHYTHPNKTTNYSDNINSFYSAPPCVQNCRETIKTRNNGDIYTMPDDLDNVYDDHNQITHHRKKSQFHHKPRHTPGVPSPQGYFEKNMNDILSPKINKIQSSNNFLHNLSESDCSDTSSSFLSESIDEDYLNVDDHNYVDQSIVHTPGNQNKNVVQPRVNHNMDYRLKNQFSHDDINDLNGENLLHPSSPSFSLSASPSLDSLHSTLSSSSSSPLSSINSSDLENSLSISLSDFSDVDNTHSDTNVHLMLQKPIHLAQERYSSVENYNNRRLHARFDDQIPKVGKHDISSSLIFQNYNDDDQDDDDMDTYSDNTDSDLSSDSNVSSRHVNTASIQTLQYSDKNRQGQKKLHPLSDNDMLSKTQQLRKTNTENIQNSNELSNISDDLLKAFNSNIMIDSNDKDKSNTYVIKIILPSTVIH